jgi:probable rRNA maturation factor
MAILIDNRQQRCPIDTKTVKKTAQAILNGLGCPEAELSIVLVDDPDIQALNSQYRGKDSPTNVLAFAMRDGDFGGVTPTLLGDVVLSIDTLTREAEAAGQAPADRLTQLLIHGILHLVGFDHEASAAAADLMEEKSRELLALLSGA